MSWATHDLEPYVLQRHLGLRTAIVPLLLGSYSPDVLTKWAVYGTTIFGLGVKPEDPAQLHRGWPGLGFTHSLAFGVAVASVFLFGFGSRVWALSFLIGQWAHVLADCGDSVGCMLLFPFTTYHFSLGAWQYAVGEGRWGDATAYFSSIGGVVWEGFWVVAALAFVGMLRREYFVTTIAPADQVWSWLGRFLPEAALLGLYRASFFYGTTRWVAWMLWVHVVHHHPVDLSWGGPAWVR